MVLVTVILAVTRSGRSGAVKDRDGDGDSQNSQMVVTLLVTSASNEGYPKVRNHGEGPY